jgi:hypothetical protein
MKLETVLTLSCLTTFGAANHEAFAYPARTRQLAIPTVTDTAHYTTLQRHIRNIPDSKEPAEKLETTIAPTGHHVAHRSGKPINGGYLVRAAAESSQATTRRAAKIYNLSIPLHDENGYIAIYITSSIASAFCEDGTGALEVKFYDSSLAIPVPAAQAVEFCMAYKEQHKNSKSPTTPRKSSHGSQTADAKPVSPTIMQQPSRQALLKRRS